MSDKIVLDSCGELPDQLKSDNRYEIVPLELQVGEERMWDDETFDQKNFLQKVAACPTCPKSACPSPERYMQAFDCAAEDIYVVTLSGNLSGSYNSAYLARSMYLEKNPDKKIHVFDSCSASCGETQIAFYISSLAEEGKSFEEIIPLAEQFRDDLTTYFVLDNLETLRKNGRLTGVKALVASTLSIKPIMAGDKGNIVQRGQSIGMKKALRRMAEIILEEVGDTQHRTLMITHCNAPDRAETIKKLLTDKVQFRDCLIMDTRGVSSMYANDGGVIVTV